MSSDRRKDRSRSDRRGDLFVLSAPSGTGKTTLVRYLDRHPWPHGEAPEFSVSHTTREPRSGEVDGVHYHFVDTSTFDSMVEANDFLEWAMVHGQRKGTARSEVADRLADGRDVLLDIDVQGAANVLEAHPDACAVLVLPPSYGELAERIAGRGADTAADIARRLSVSLWEIERYTIYDYVIINDEVDRAGRELAAIITARRATRERREADVERILEDFRNSIPGTTSGANPEPSSTEPVSPEPVRLEEDSVGSAAGDEPT